MEMNDNNNKKHKLEKSEQINIGQASTLFRCNRLIYCLRFSMLCKYELSIEANIITVFI